MTGPVDEKLEPPLSRGGHERISDEERTVVGEGSITHGSPDTRKRQNSHLTVETVRTGVDSDHDPLRTMQSPSRSREEAHRLDDDLTMLQVEQQVSQANQSTNADDHEHTKPLSMHRSRSRRHEPVDDFDVATNPIHEKTSIYKPPEHPTTTVSKIFKKIHNSSSLIRYITYITPLVLIILIPLLLGVFLFPNASVGGVKLVWFCIWLEIVWLTLWAGRILAKCLPWPIGLISSLFTNNDKKWRDMGKQLELPATLFFWGLAIEISFLPTMKNHHIDGNHSTRDWEQSMNKVIIAFFVATILNFAEKIIIQLIAISFHLRTYQDRIELNKFQIASLTKLYQFSKEKITMEDSEFEPQSGTASGARTPGQLVKEAQKSTVQGIKKIGDLAGRIAGDFTGRQVEQSTHPAQVILTLLNTTSGSQILARRLYRTFAREETETVHGEDLRPAFENDEEADAAFSMFDKDMNGDISMEELEAVCVEIGRERKAITASLKDLDSVVSKLDDVFMFIVFIVAVLVLISLISTSAAGVLTSAGSTVLALSWLLSATAQEFLQSIIFVFVKHPFDVGDRVGIYGNTGSQLKGDDYFVKEISLLYTEFKKMEGHVVQAPNSYLNTLFILNQRRSGGLAEAIPVTIKFGTTLDQIDALRSRLLEFVTAEKREYQTNILTELREVSEAHSITLNVVFFYKSNWQNELLRLQRRNKFICALMVSMQELGIEGPRMRYPGQKESFPVYLQNVPHIGTPGTGHGGHPDNPQGVSDAPHDPPFVQPAQGSSSDEHHSALRSQSTAQSYRRRGESLGQMSRRVDFSLGMRDISSADPMGDVYTDRERPRLPSSVQSPSRSRQSQDRTSQDRSMDMGRSTSVNSDLPGRKLQRIGTDSTVARNRSSHRNRFFGRGRSNDEDIESGMADIPEMPSTGGSFAQQGQRIDPRTGFVSPRAMHDEPGASGAIPPSGAVHSAPRRAKTDSFEMKHL